MGRARLFFAATVSVVFAAPAAISPATTGPPSACFETKPTQVQLYAGQSLRIPIAIRSQRGGVELKLHQASVKPARPGIRARAASGQLALQAGSTRRLLVDLWVDRAAGVGAYKLAVPYTVVRGSGCRASAGSVPVDVVVLKPAPLSKTEMGVLAKALPGKGVLSYSVAEFLGQLSKQGIADFHMVRAGTVRGRLVMRRGRELKAVKVAGPRVYHDGRGSLVLYGDIGRRGEAPMPYSLTLSPGPSRTLAIDGNRDGFADLVLSGTDNLGLARTRFAMFADPFGRMLFECLNGGRQVTPQLVSELDGASRRGGSGANPCSRSGGLESSLGGGGGRSSRFPGSELLGKPDCAPPRPRGPFGDDPGGGAVGDEEESHSAAGGSNASGGGSSAGGASAATGGGASGSAGGGSGSTSGSYSSPQEVALAALRDEQARSVLQPSPQESSGGSQGGTGGVAEALKDLPARVLPNASDALNALLTGDLDQIRGGSAEVTVGDRGGTHVTAKAELDDKDWEVSVTLTVRNLPPVGPDGLPSGDFVDPRCSKATSVSLWAPGCSILNMTTCLKRQMDTLYGATDGRCEMTTGPDDRPHFTCRTKEEEDQRDDTSPRGVGGRGSGATDLPCQGPGGASRAGCRGAGRSSGMEGRFVDTTALGGVLAAFCQADGCPDFARMVTR